MSVDVQSTPAGRAAALKVTAIAVVLAAAVPAEAQQSGRTLPGGQQQQLPAGCVEQIARIIGRPDFESFINKCWLPAGAAGNPKLPPNYAGLSCAVPVKCLEYAQNIDRQWRDLERCLLVTIEDKPSRLPSLRKGTHRGEGIGKVLTCPSRASP